MNDTLIDIAIIGAGMAGLSCAYHLRGSGRRVALFDPGHVGHEAGSSCGQSRMYREMYSDPYLATMARESNRRWDALERRHGVELRRQHGLLFYGEAFEEETIEGSIPGARRVMDAQNIPYETLDANGIAARWAMAPSKEFVGLFEPTAGAVLSDRVLELYAREVRAADGMTLHEGEGIADWGPRQGGGYWIQTQAGRRVEARRVVLAVGAWTNVLLAPLGERLALELWSMVWGHYAVDPDLADRYPQWFCFQEARGDDGGLYYGFPVLSRAPDGRPMVKVGIDWAPEALRADSVEALPSEPPTRLVELLEGFLRTQLRGIEERIEIRTSPYTMTRDVNFVLDTLRPDLVLFTGGSGQAFKFAPLIGELMAELALGRAPGLDITPWSCRRPAVAQG
jgi:glycine/D-amino acid oxidase-like deaminating enzyme